MADKIDDLIQRIDKLVKAVEKNSSNDDLSRSIDKLVTVVGQNTAQLLAGDKGSGHGRYSTGMFGYSNMLANSKDSEKLYQMFQLSQKTNRQSVSVLGRVVKDMQHSKRDIESATIDLQRTADDFEKSKKSLQETLGSTTKDSNALFKEALNKIKEYRDDIKKAEDELSGLTEAAKTAQENFDKLNEKIYGGKTDAQKRKLDKILSSDKSTLTKTDKKEAKLSQDEFDEYRSLLADVNKAKKDEADKQEEVNGLKEKSVKLEQKTNKAISDGNDELNKQVYKRELSFRIMRDGLNQIKGGFKDIWNIGKQFANAWMKIDTASSNFARNIGMGSAGMTALRQNSINRIANTILSDKYGVGMEDLVKLQAGYTSAIGRNVGLSDLDQENAIAMNVVMGEKGGQLASSLENFGLSYSDAAKTAGKMFKDASKYGLSFEKYSENFLSNIKIAQNYTFKNGLKGLESMAKKATAIKLDMQQVSAFADKVGTLQGSVETAAKLQVLGGPFAQFSDPLGMLNESMTDMEGLIDRFQNMVGGLGRFDAQQGQVVVSAFNKQRIKAAAEAMGMNYDQVMESVQAQGRRNYIEKAIGNGNWTDEEREFIMNTASVKEGKPTLSYINASGNRVEKDVSKMSKDELREAKLQNQSQSDDIKNIATDTRQMAQQITGVQNKADAIRAKKFEGIHKVVETGITLVNRHLKTIIWLITAAGIGGGMLKIGRGIGGTLNGMRGVKETGGFFNFGFGSRLAKTGAKSAGSALAKSAAKGGALGLVLGLAGEGTSLLIQNGNRKNIEQGKYKENSKKDLTHKQNAKAASWAGTGAAIGATIGSVIPVIGTAVGAAVGALVGGIGGTVVGGVQKRKELKRQEAKGSINRLGYDISDNYSKKEMETILSAIKNGTGNTISEAEFNTFSKDLQDKIIANGDAGLFPELQNIAVSSKDSKFDIENGDINIANGNINKKSTNTEKAYGGLIHGPSHAQGGVPIIGAGSDNPKRFDYGGVEAEGNEFIVNKESTKKWLPLLKAINSDRNGSSSVGSIIKPKVTEMIKVIPTLLTDGAVGAMSGGAHSGVRDGGTSDINLNFKGKISLDFKGKDIDITDELLKSPVFIRKITKLIEKQLVVNEKGGNVVKKGLY